MKAEDFIKEIEKKLAKTDITPKAINEGEVLSIGDGIVKVSGLSKAGFGEEVVFEDKTKGLVFSLDEEEASVILLSDTNKIVEGMKAKTTGVILGINVSNALIGRVINPLREPLDDKKLDVGGKFYPLEKIAPGVIARQSVDTPVKTGIKAIDSMIPIGRGQRELIIGDRSTGKTAIAIDTIINQKEKDLGLKQLLCVYCAIGQKRGNVARTIAKLEEEGAMDYTVVVASTSSDSPALQYLAPFTACSIAEYFMDRGEDVLIVFDDFTKHAWAYRQISLLLRRPAGREAYPGDIFYLHSRLLERAARISDKLGGGSITALPIIETQAGDVSAYIPTNVISITDGQIYLENDLFNAGIRPAVNAGLSVSRVGGAAQTKSMKQLSGQLRLELSQYNDLAAFAQFGSDLDEKTQKQIERGKRVVEILKQPQYMPYTEADEIISIYSATSGILDELDIEQIASFENKAHDYIRVRNKALYKKLESGEKLDDKTLAMLSKNLEEFVKTVKKDKKPAKDKEEK